jgi:hypothetical protein
MLEYLLLTGLSNRVLLFASKARAYPSEALLGATLWVKLFCKKIKHILYSQHFIFFVT